LKEPHAREFDITGRPMTVWVVVEPAPKIVPLDPVLVKQLHLLEKQHGDQPFCFLIAWATPERYTHQANKTIVTAGVRVSAGLKPQRPGK